MYFQSRGLTTTTLEMQQPRKDLSVAEIGSDGPFREYQRDSNLDPEEFEIAYSTKEAAVSGALSRFFPEEKVRQWVLTKTGGLSSSGSCSGLGTECHDGDDIDAELYKPILDPYEMRVLELEPGVGDETLRGSLHHCSLEFDNCFDLGPESGPLHPTRHALSMRDLTEPVWYTALSYTWGPPVFEAKIECDGHEKAITASLEAALRQFRRPDRSVVMWIDQVCIDQDNQREKEQQIPLMARIYSHATNTVIWLGEASAGSDLAIRALEHISYCLQLIDADVGPDDFGRFLLPTPDSETWEEVWNLLCRPWFSRVWIVQELVLSGDPWVVCGDRHISWKIIGSAFNHLEACGIARWLRGKFAPSNLSNHVSSGQGQGLEGVKQRFSSRSGGIELFRLLDETRNAQCYDSRDKVYGLLGMCSDTDRAAVRISYADDNTAVQLFRDVTAHYLRAGGALYYVLCSVDHGSSDIPSWVPDWRKPRRTPSLGSHSRSWNVYRACGRFMHGFDGWEGSTIRTSPLNKDELGVRGVFFDSLVKTSRPFTEPDLTFINPASTNHTLIASAQFASHLQTYPNSDTVFNAFWRTLVAGKDGSGRFKCPQSFAEIFCLLLDESTGLSPTLPGQTYSTRQKLPRGRGRLELTHLNSRTYAQIYQEVRTSMTRALRNRRLGITKKGYLGLFPAQSKEEDSVYVLHSCNVPFLIRSTGSTIPLSRLVGECFVYGAMEGEAVAGEDTGLESIVLV